MRPLVSVIIPVYNAEAWLWKTITNVLEQTWSRLEVIVIDDGSTDNSAEIVRQCKDSRVRLMRQPNRGGCAARNTGLKAAKGDYIQFLDADDLMAPDKLAVQIETLQNAPVGAVANARWERFYTDEPVDIHFREKPYYGDRDSGFDWAVDAVAGHAMMPPHAWLLPRSIVAQTGPWNEDLLINQDGEYFNRVALATKRMVFCKDARVYYRSGISGSVSQQDAPHVLKSKLHSLELITRQLLTRERSLRVRQACAAGYFELAHDAHPTAPEVVERAVDRIEQLRVSKANFAVEGSALARVIYSLLGWRTAKRLRHWYYRLRYGRNG